MAAAAFLNSLADEIVTANLLPRTGGVVVGVSGGLDSMALLHVAVGLNREAGFGLDLHIAHLDHQLRGLEAEKDAAFVQAAADDLNLPCTAERRDIAKLAESASGSIEEVARGERYTFLEGVARRCGAGTVIVGHQADDNAETILHRIIRGTGFRGLCGIPRSRPIQAGSQIQLVRPLLRRTRRELSEFLSECGIPYREDRTNQDNEPMRNRIRNLVLPLLEAEINPQAREALLRLGEQACWLEEFLTEMVQKTLETLIISHTDQELVLNAVALAKRSRIVQTELIRRAAASFQAGEQDMGFAQLVAVADMLDDPASGKQVHLPGGIIVTKSYESLSFALPTDEPREAIAPEIAIRLPGTTLLPVRRIAIECQITTSNAGELAGHRIQQVQRGATRVVGRGRFPIREEWVDLDSVHPPLVVRTRQPGDRFWPLGAPGSKKLSEFLSDHKVDPRERQRIAVLCDQLGPIWIIGYRIDDRVKITSLTRQVLKLRAEPVGD